MAVTLNINLTTPEQAKVSAWLEEVLPGKTPAEQKAALEAHARRLLRDDLVGRVRDARVAALREAENQARQAEQGGVEVVDVFV